MLPLRLICTSDSESMAFLEISGMSNFAGVRWCQGKLYTELAVWNVSAIVFGYVTLLLSFCFCLHCSLGHSASPGTYGTQLSHSPSAKTPM